MNAFTLGARSVNPKVQTHVVFTEDWCDPVKQRSAAAELLAKGVDVSRTILKAAERARVFSIGYHADGSQVAPKGWLLGSVWDWHATYVDIVRTILGGDSWTANTMVISSAVCGPATTPYLRRES